jgi:hypothetical protein
MQVVDTGLVDRRESLREKTGLLLIVTFEAYAVAGSDGCRERLDDILRRHDLAARISCGYATRRSAHGQRSGRIAGR